MPWHIRLVSLADGSPAEHPGEFVLYYDPNAGRGTGYVLTTPDLAKSLAFLTRGEALAELMRVADAPDDRRPDGGRNRPLTAFAVEIVHSEPWEAIGGEPGAS